MHNGGGVLNGEGPSSCASRRNFGWADGEYGGLDARGNQLDNTGLRVVTAWILTGNIGVAADAEGVDLAHARHRLDLDLEGDRGALVAAGVAGQGAHFEAGQNRTGCAHIGYGLAVEGCRPGDVIGSWGRELVEFGRHIFGVDRPGVEHVPGVRDLITRAGFAGVGDIFVDGTLETRGLAVDRQDAGAKEEEFACACALHGGVVVGQTAVAGRN